MKPLVAMLSVLTITRAACDDAPTAPTLLAPESELQAAAAPRGTGLVLNNVIELPVDVIGEVPVNVDAVSTGLQFSALAESR